MYNKVKSTFGNYFFDRQSNLAIWLCISDVHKKLRPHQSGRERPIVIVHPFYVKVSAFGGHLDISSDECVHSRNVNISFPVLFKLLQEVFPAT